MPLSNEERAAISAKHEPADDKLTRCIRDGEPWPCDVVRLLEVADAAAAFAESWGGSGGAMSMLPDEYGFTMQCDEAEAVADLYRAVGLAGAAEAILDDHAVYDTDEDSHHARGREVVRREMAARPE